MSQLPMNTPTTRLGTNWLPCPTVATKSLALLVHTTKGTSTQKDFQLKALVLKSGKVETFSSDLFYLTDSDKALSLFSGMMAQ